VQAPKPASCYFVHIGSAEEQILIIYRKPRHPFGPSDTFSRI